ncbi:hypothetical protein [Mycobacterium sp. Marseille-P9652]|uniref:hypothetical protein n=1 Tax=Mycobacterium sp. Marseille-P9652 TaxID=2654950 RepID=UPI0012E7073B|nr:hypothetical protein [Mycobacterium sp. Marseille-P9652]
MATLSMVLGVLAAAAPFASADPIDKPIEPNPYPPDSVVLTSYTRVDPADYFMPGLYGVYFLSPTGLNCGVWLRGSFGCEGVLPGAPPGTDHIGWFNGDTTVHHDPFIAIGFPHVRAARVMPPRSYVNWNETTCVITADNSTYCHRGMFRFMVTGSYTAVMG